MYISRRMFNTLLFILKEYIYLSVEPTLYFGLGTIQKINSLRTVLINLRTYRAINIKVNQELELSPKKHFDEESKESKMEIRKTYF